MAVFAGLVAALGIVPGFTLPAIGVPVTAQTLGVMLAGAILGARRGFGALALFLALAAVGLPVLANGRGGLGAFVGPSFGFLIGFPLAAFVVGWLTERGGTPYRFWWGLMANVVGGIVFLYPLGLAGMVLVGHLPLGNAAVGLLAFIPGDVLKAVLAALVARGVHAAYPGLIPARKNRAKEPAAV